MKNKKGKKKSNKTLYFGVILIVSILLLFVCSHFLQVKYGSTRQWWMGIEVSNLFTDLTLYLAIGLMFVILILWIKYYISRKGIMMSSKTTTKKR